MIISSSSADGKKEAPEHLEWLFWTLKEGEKVKWSHIINLQSALKSYCTMQAMRALSWDKKEKRERSQIYFDTEKTKPQVEQERKSKKLRNWACCFLFLQMTMACHEAKISKFYSWWDDERQKSLNEHQIKLCCFKVKKHFERANFPKPSIILLKFRFISTALDMIVVPHVFRPK